MDNRTKVSATQPAANATTNTQPTDPRAAEEARAIANTAILLRICADNIMDLQDKILNLQEHFDAYTEESSGRQNLKKLLLGVAGVASTMGIICEIIYRASSTCGIELTASNILWYDSLALTGSLYGWFYANVSPDDRSFKWNEYLAKVFASDFKKLMSEFDDFVISLQMLSANLRTTYGNDNASLQLVYFDLEKEIDTLKDKDQLTINKVREEITKVNQIINYSKTMIEYTKGYSPGLFDPRPGRQARLPRPERRLDMRIDDDTYMRGLKMV